MAKLIHSLDSNRIHHWQLHFVPLVDGTEHEHVQSVHDSLAQPSALSLPTHSPPHFEQSFKELLA
jgi:hypothetical protein